ncbi:HAMP domain-containing histidine kinase [Dyadobacter sp. CY261]|uniref:sensor histidine kinase n=1 Tax=Dyadobacter sp. CY261 TaxID=2907203 RepID=UPI001F261D26|nr:HAMP domain-containing sensor histidine kinase [Dyadobacter sp. CY261]MCF0070162.1 HAMP domain-containing histidine kinase [Dyadobacter sp. CY261]
MLSQWIFVIILTAVMLAFCLWMSHRYSQLNHAKKALERQVEDLSKKLEYSNSLRQKITMMIAHDLQSPLHFLNVLSEHVSRFAANNQLSEVKAGTEEIKKATANIHAFVKEVNLWARSQHENFQLAQHSFPFAELVAELQQFFGEMLWLNNNVLIVDYPHDVFVYTHRDILKAILRNLIDNANKHTRSGTIRLTFTQSECGALLTVSDNGGGMLSSDLQKIRRRLANPMLDAPVEATSRLGYQLMGDLAHTLGYKLDLASIKGEGTSVSITGLVCRSSLITELHSTEVVGLCQPD